jgi:hypothetical protein
MTIIIGIAAAAAAMDSFLKQGDQILKTEKQDIFINR